MKPIYKVTSEDLTTRLEKELDNVATYMTESMEAAKELVPELSNIAIRKCSFTGKHTIIGLILNDGADISLYKKTSTTADGDHILVPKRNSNKGRALSDALHFVGKSVTLFDEKKFEEELGFNPAKREEFEGGYMILNVLRFGYQLVGDNKVFVFGGYDGYEPPKGIAEEMKVSEYNALFGR